MSVELYIHSRNGTQSDRRTGSLAEAPADVTLTLNGTPLGNLLQLVAGDVLLIDVQETGVQPPAPIPAPLPPSGPVVA